MRKRICIGMFLSIGVLAFLTGCSNKKNSVQMPVRETEVGYFGTTYLAERDNLDFTLELDIKPDEVSTVSQGFKPYVQECSIEQVFFGTGEVVKKGDLLIKLPTTEIDNSIADCEKQIRNKELELLHYERLKEIDPGENYDDFIELNKSAIETLKTSINDLEEKKLDYEIHAECDGRIEFIDSSIKNFGKYDGNENVISIAQSNGMYCTVTQYDTGLKKGDKMKAEKNDAEYEFEITDIIQNNSVAEGKSTKYILKPLFDMNTLDLNSVLKAKVERPVFENVVYVDINAVTTLNGKSFVFVIGENGIPQKREIEKGLTVDEKVIVESGLSGGEILCAK